ncbi:MAG: diguanylate cyclase [Negativicutes bacterium]
MKQLFSKILDSLNIGVMLVDNKYTVMVWNDWLEQVSGISKQEAVGQKIGDLCPSFRETSLLNILECVIKDGQNRFCSGMLHNTFIYPPDMKDIKNTNRQNMQLEAFYYNDEVYALIQINDITSQYRRVHWLQNLVKEMEVDYKHVKKSEENAKKNALYDPLTGLCNRTLFYERLNQALEEAGRDKHLAGLLFVDLDAFKSVNDTYGHAAGDFVLKEASGRLKATVRQTDTICRLGGDEYTIILPGVKSKHDIGLIACKIIKAFKPVFTLNNKEILVTVSVGISVFPENGHDPEILLKQADSAMYAVKTSGKNGYKFY